MIQKLPKACGVALLASLVLLTAGCSGTNNNAVSNVNDNSGSDTSPITFSFFGADANPNWNNMQDDVGKEITAKTGGYSGC